MRKVILMIMTMLFTLTSYAKDLGIVGQTYPILEEDFLLFIQNRLQIMKQNGEWQKIETQFRDNVEKHADRPNPVSEISKTTQAETWNFDLSLIVPYDLMDAQGRIFVKAGTSINPLQYRSLSNVLLFFDGDDVKQVAWAKKIDLNFNGKTRLILVKGSITQNEKLFSKAIYFDQSGRLTTRFQIQHVPAIVQQEGSHLKISEVLP